MFQLTFRLFDTNTQTHGYTNKINNNEELEIYR
jgi:hypothetical protein